MPTPEAPPRKRFQIHLSTAIVMMFVAGGLIWANVHAMSVPTIGSLGAFMVDHTVEQKMQLTEEEFQQTSYGVNWDGCRAYSYGWPLKAVVSSEFVMVRKGGETISFQAGGPKCTFNITSMIVNGLAGIAILIAVWLLCEYLIRRRAAHKSE